jgi:hypothetical protein
LNTSRDMLGELIKVVGRRNLPPRAHYEQVFAAATQAWQRKLRSQRRRRLLYAAAATLAGVGIAVGTFVHWTPRTSSIGTTVVLRGNAAMLLPWENAWRPLQLGSIVPAGARVRTGAGSGLAIALERGTAVRVKEQSELTMQSAHILRLRIGTVYVDSGRGPSADSVRIETAMGTVRDIGTIFEVHAVSNALRIRVREGRVELEAPGQLERFSSAAGEQLDIDRVGVVRRAVIAPNHSAWLWAEALAAAPEIDGRPLLPFLGDDCTFRNPESKRRHVRLFCTARLAT